MCKCQVMLLAPLTRPQPTPEADVRGEKCTKTIRACGTSVTRNARVQDDRATNKNMEKTDECWDDFIRTRKNIDGKRNQAVAYEQTLRCLQLGCYTWKVIEMLSKHPQMSRINIITYNYSIYVRSIKLIRLIE